MLTNRFGLLYLYRRVVLLTGVKTGRAYDPLCAFTGPPVLDRLASASSPRPATPPCFMAFYYMYVPSITRAMLNNPEPVTRDGCALLNVLCSFRYAFSLISVPYIFLRCFHSPFTLPSSRPFRACSECTRILLLMTVSLPGVGEQCIITCIIHKGSEWFLTAYCFKIVRR